MSPPARFCPFSADRLPTSRRFTPGSFALERPPQEISYCFVVRQAHMPSKELRYPHFVFRTYASMNTKAARLEVAEEPAIPC